MWPPAGCKTVQRMTIAELVANVRRYDPPSNPLGSRAFTRSPKGRTGEQRRASGESYIEHPLAVAAILADLEMDRSTIAAALLHDVVEDTVVTSEEVAERFGDEIASLVDGVTKLTQHPVPDEGRCAGREPAQNVPGDGQGHPRHHHQARRPPAQHAHAGLASAGEAADDRARDARDLRADRPPPGHLAASSGISRTSRCATSIPTPYHDIAERVAKKRGEREAAVASA